MSGEIEEFVPQSCDFLVVGGGAVGLSVAYNLARKEAGSVVLMDRRAFGTGATNKSGGGMRRVFSERIGTQVTLRSFDILRTLEAEVDETILHQVGYLYLLAVAAHEREAERILTYVDELAPETVRRLTAAEAAGEFPWIDTAGLSQVLWSPEDGFVEPMELAGALTRAARRRGARLMNGVRVESLEMSGGRIASVRTSAGEISVGTVILASNAGSRELARTAGVELPLEQSTAQRFLLDRVPPADRPYPFTFALGDGFAFRGDGDGAMVGFTGGGQVFPSGEHGIDWDDAKTGWRRLVKRVPGFSGHTITGGVFGVLDRTPDAYPMVGFHEDVPNLFCACGFYGSGVMQSLGAGEAASELLTAGECSFADISVLDPNRFRHDKALPAHEFF